MNYIKILPCGCPSNEPESYGRCVLREPLWRVVPPEGVHLDCSVHPQGHHVYGN